MTPNLLYFLAGALFGALIASVALVLWALEAMSPHGEVTAEWAPGAKSDLERYAARRAEGVE